MRAAGNNPRAGPAVEIGEDRFLAGRVALLYEQATFGIVGGVVCALVVGIAFSAAGDPGEIALWTGGFALVSVVRLWLVHRFRRSQARDRDARQWSHRFIVLCLVAGLWWGYAGVGLADGQPEEMRLFIYIVIGGVCASSVATYAAVLPAFLAFTAGALGPMIIGLTIFSDEATGVLVGSLMVVFLLVLASAAVKQSDTIKATLQVRFDNLGLIEVLETAMDDAAALNDSLTAEIRQRERIEKDLARSLALYQATMDAVDEGILALDQEQRIVAINQRFRDLWGLRAVESRPGISHDAAEQRVEDQQKSVLSDPAPAEDGTELIELTDGRIFERQIVPYRLDGEVIGRVRTIRDVSSRIRAERELRRAMELAEQSNRAKSDFLARVSHELRTPLTAIIGFSEIYLREMFGKLANERYLDYANDIHDSAKLLLSLINDLLDLSKIEAGVIELDDTPIEVPKTARQSFRLVRSHAAEAGVKIEFAVPTDLPVLRCDERALKQMLVNLLSNAIKFTPKGGLVTLAANVDASGEMIVAVADTGVGLSDEQIVRALEPFKQIDNPLTPHREGTGLGLPLVKALIEAHGGRLEVASAPDLGTTIRLIFPASRLESTAAGQAKTRKPPPATKAGRGKASA